VSEPQFDIGDRFAVSRRGGPIEFYEVDAIDHQLATTYRNQRVGWLHRVLIWAHLRRPPVTKIDRVAGEVTLTARRIDPPRMHCPICLATDHDSEHPHSAHVIIPR